ncbi:MAG TPA: S8 family serine peptidase [Gaiellaceae bacterium]|nr:S8 family serine peptidase [Gaiellaceae bacterium]
MSRPIALACALFALALPAGAAAATSDPLFSQQWGLQQINADEAWATSTGAGQIVAVVDSGVDLAHPDLAGKLVPGTTFSGCATQPNGCGNGGWLSGNTTDPPSPHGTHVAGIVAAATNNGIGVAGVAPDAKVMPVKSLTDAGGSFEEIAAGIRWAVDHGADVINMSLGALPGVHALVITGVIADVANAIDYAFAHNVPVIVAAGNEFASICAEPSFDAGALCVTSTDRNELRSSFSNFGVKPDLNVVAAPGGAALLACGDDIVSTVPAGSEGSCGSGGYDYYAGTSMATPHVAGVAALLTAQGRGASQVYVVLKSTARTPGLGLRGTYTPVYGYGIVDAAAAVAAP